MKHHLQAQSASYADLVCHALNFTQTMLKLSRTLYPFALVSSNNTSACLFVQNETQLAQKGMIEALQAKINDANLHTQHVCCVLAYQATILGRNNEPQDAVVLNMSDCHGENTVTVYPIEASHYPQQKGVVFGMPFSCDFSD